MPQTLEDLMRELQFDHTDLAANRDGALGANQRARLQRLRARYLAVGIAIMLTLSVVVAALFYIGLTQERPILNLLAFALVFLDGLGMALLGRHYALLSAELGEGQVVHYEGVLERVVRPQGRRVGQYLLRLDGAEFYVPKEVFKHFVHQAPYRLYCSPRTRTLLAAEPLEAR